MADQGPGRVAVVVTGGASGIGAAVAERLRRSGARVVVLDRAAPRDIECDVSDPAAVEAAMTSVVRQTGAPSRLVACAGVGHSGPLLDVSPADFRRVLDVNLLLELEWVTGQVVQADGGLSMHSPIDPYGAAG